MIATDAEIDMAYSEFSRWPEAGGPLSIPFDRYLGLWLRRQAVRVGPTHGYPIHGRKKGGAGLARIAVAVRRAAGRHLPR